MAPYLSRLLDEEEHPYLERIVTEVGRPGQDEVFGRRLEMVLDGLALRLR
ncbi:hypothetical protein [Streptosporangium saharense]